jgi:hypothetical protein
MNQSRKENAGKFRAPRQVVSEGECFAPVRFPPPSPKPEHARLGSASRQSSLGGQVGDLTRALRQSHKQDLESIVDAKKEKATSTGRIR